VRLLARPEDLREDLGFVLRVDGVWEDIAARTNTRRGSTCGTEFE
jgi:hypothetical protein